MQYANFTFIGSSKTSNFLKFGVVVEYGFLYHSVEQLSAKLKFIHFEDLDPLHLPATNMEVTICNYLISLCT